MSRTNKNKTQQHGKKVYLYARLSNEDDNGQGDSSNSIQHQQLILEKYAVENGYKDWEFVYDDGFLGGDWSRPSFTKMIEEVEAGNVLAIICKDLSRFGRGHLKVGYYTEMLFPKMDVRFVAIGDNVDSDMGENDIAPMLNIFNEWYLKSTSKKIRAVTTAKGNAGERLAVIPIYGYKKDENSRSKTALVLDDESAAVVQRIFKMFIEGMPMAQIAQKLMGERILNPSAYKYERGIMAKQRPMKDPYLWNPTTIQKILDTPEYLGKTTNFKTYSKSYKDNKSRFNSPENMIVFENTHEPIIDQTTWDIVRKMRQTKRYAPRYGKVGMFTGLLHCSDCNEKLYYSSREIWNKDKTISRIDGAYSCSNYWKTTQYQQPRVCTCHYIREKSLVNVVRSILKVTMEYVNFDTEAFAKEMMEKSQKDKLAEIARNKRSLAQKRTRIEELDKLFERIYEDNVVGKLSDERFAKMSAKYEGEQKSLLEEVNALEISITDNENQLGGVDKFIELTKQHLEFREVTPALINAFIDKIIVHEPEKKRGANRNQFVEVIFNFVGPVEID